MTDAARRFLLALTPVCALAIASLAGAHAFLDHATPAVGSEVHGPPAQVKLWFTQALEPAFSKVQVLDAKGNQVDKGDVEVDHSDPTLLEVSVPPLGPGEYRVAWRVLSVDTHVTEGNFTFDVAP
jgi:copper resistance protein C